MPSYRYPRPAVTVDVVVFAAGGDGELLVLLVQRAAPPFAGRWALPGGFVDPDEDLPAAAARELREETSSTVPRLVQLGAYGAPGRDPRGHTVSVVFLAASFASRGAGAAGTAGDDARALRWCSARRPPPLAFDHRVVLRDACARFAELAEDRATFARAFGAGARRAAAERLRRAARRSR